MTEEERDLLFQDLCTRLPYEVKVDHFGTVKELLGIMPSSENVMVGYDINDYEDSVIEDIKPYLRSLSTMTEEENLSLAEFVGVHISARYGEIYFPNLSDNTVCNWHKVFDWLNKNMFDYRGLIPMGLANESPEGMYNN